MKAIRRDDGLEWLREIRARLAKKFDYSPEKAAAYYRTVQSAYQATATGRTAKATSYRPARKNSPKRSK